MLFRPEAITDELADAIASFNRVDPEHPLRSRNVTVGVSLNHPDELQPEVITALTKFTRRGVAVRGQTALLKGINDNAQVLRRLIDIFLAIGLSPYYLFHCMDVVGTYHMRTSVQRGLDLLAELAEFSGTTAMPYVYVTPVATPRRARRAAAVREHRGKRYIRRARRTAPRASSSSPARRRSAAARGRRGRLHRLPLSQRRRRADGD